MNRWKKIKIRTNDEKLMDAWQHEDFIIYINNNKGRDIKKGKKDNDGYYWWTEIQKNGKYLDEVPSIAEAKKFVENFKKGLS